ncbi:MAG: helix-turn-helix transcriptional regulator [Roseateles sp.]
MHLATQSANQAQSYVALDPLLKLHAVKSATGLGRSSIYKKVAAGDFPQPVRLGARAVAWRSSEIAAWIASRSVASRSVANLSE